jgi:hypothetical protein
MAKVVVPVLCSSGIQYRVIYYRGILQTFAHPQRSSPRVIPYFGVRTLLALSFFDHFNRKAAVLGTGRLDKFISMLFRKASERFPVESSSNPNIPARDGIAMRFPIRESAKNVPKRFLVLLNWLIETQEFDFVWHSNISTYLNLEAMDKHLEKVSEEFYYAGVIGTYENFGFVSGASVCLGRDTVKLILTNADKWDYSLLWDVSLGKLLHSLNVVPSEIPRVDISKPSQASTISEEILRSTINFRCKSGRWVRRDHKIMDVIHKRLKIN